MAAHDFLAGLVRPELLEGLPVEEALVLPGEFDLRVQTCMHEDVLLRFVIWKRASQEGLMLLGNFIRPIGGAMQAVGHQRFKPAACPPRIGPERILSSTQHHHFMVAAQENAISPGHLIHKAIEHLLRLGTAIHIVAEEYHNVLLRRLKDFPERS